MNDSSKTAKETSQSRSHPSNSDMCWVHPNTDARIHLRDDGCIVLRAKDTVLLIDGESGQITLDGKKILNFAQEAMTIRTDPTRLSINDGLFNPSYLDPNIPDSLEVFIQNLINKIPMIFSDMFTVAAGQKLSLALQELLLDIQRLMNPKPIDFTFEQKLLNEAKKLE